MMKVKKRGRNILVCSDRRCSYESTESMSNHLQVGRNRKGNSKIVKQYEKNDNFEKGDSLGDLFDF